MKTKLAVALSTLALQGPAHEARAADVFSVPLVDGQTWAFLQSGSILNSDGSSSTWGPDRVDVQFQAVDVQVLDHHADWHVLGAGDNYGGNYLAQTAAGPLLVSQGNAATDAVYRYFIDPRPWPFPNQPLDVGVPVVFSGQFRGVWAVPGGTEAWTGHWSETYTNLGIESVTTPLGTFSALKLQSDYVTTIDTRALFPNASGHASWNELRWFVPGRGYVKVQGSGLDETDFDGDGIVDRWQRESQVMVAVPEPAALWTLPAGLALLAAWRRRVASPALRG
jgi:hypothetical protein